MNDSSILSSKQVGLQTSLDHASSHQLPSEDLDPILCLLCRAGIQKERSVWSDDPGGGEGRGGVRRGGEGSGEGRGGEWPPDFPAIPKYFYA